jgi:hypothetical protein
MTKTTNYEISKKLKEIGFDKETNFYFTEVAPDKFEAQYYTNNKKYLLLKSYDLETLLDALRKVKWFSCKIGKKEACFGYYEIYRDKKNELQERAFLINNLNGESLADTAGRLLILLHEKNLIKF